jgi:hypothetical protein
LLFPIIFTRVAKMNSENTTLCSNFCAQFSVHHLISPHNFLSS